MKSFNQRDRSKHEETVEILTIFGRRYSYIKPSSNNYDRKFVQIATDIENEYKGIFYSKPD